jgi:hypothetical protein
MKKSFSLSSKFIVCSKQLSGLRDRRKWTKGKWGGWRRCVLSRRIKEKIHSQTGACSALWRTPLQMIFMSRRTSVRLHLRDRKSVSVKGWWAFSLVPGWVSCIHSISKHTVYSCKRAALCACYCSNSTEFQFPLSLALLAVLFILPPSIDFPLFLLSCSLCC